MATTQAQELWSQSAIAERYEQKKLTFARYGYEEVETENCVRLGGLGKPDHPGPAPETRTEYLAGRAMREALLDALDINGYRQFTEVPYKYMSDEKLLVSIHRARAESRYLPAEARAESQRWLREHAPDACTASSSPFGACGCLLLLFRDYSFGHKSAQVVDELAFEQAIVAQAHPAASAFHVHLIHALKAEDHNVLAAEAAHCAIHHFVCQTALIFSIHDIFMPGLEPDVRLAFPFFYIVVAHVYQFNDAPFTRKLVGLPSRCSPTHFLSATIIHLFHHSTSLNFAWLKVLAQKQKDRLA